MSEQDKDWLTKFNEWESEQRLDPRDRPQLYDDYVKKDKLEDILSIKVYYYHNDHLGTPNELTNDKGEVVWLADYAAWGSISKEEYQSQAIGDFDISAEELQPIRFQGQSFDAETGLHYNRFRYYDSDMGMFISRDPIGLMGGDNVFQYAPNPTGWIDPLGLSGFVGTAIRTAGTAAAADLAVLEPTDAFWPKLAVEVAIVAGAAAYESSQNKAKSNSCTSGNCCPPCRTVSGKIVNPGVIGYRLDRVPPSKLHYPFPGDHYNLSKANQNPNNCKCFWQPIGAIDASNGKLPPPNSIPIEPFI